MGYDYLSSNFVFDKTVDDKRIRIFNKEKELIHSIDPMVSYFYLSNSCIIIKIINKNDIKLSFKDIDDAIKAMDKLVKLKEKFRQ